MANFCKYCGKALQDGEICSCPQAQAEAAQQYQSQQPLPQQPPQNYQLGYQQPPQGYQPQQPPQGYQQAPQGYQPQQLQRPAGPNPVVIALQKVLPYLQSYVKAPVSAARDFAAQRDMTFTGVLLCIQAIAGGLLLFGFLQSICGVISSAMGLAGGFLGGGVSVSANFFMSLIFGILATAAAIAIYVLIIFAISKIMGSNCTIQDVAVAAAAHTPFVTVLLLLSFILCLLVMWLGLIVFSVTMLAWIVLTIPTLQSLTSNSDQGKFWICAIVGVLAAQLIGCWAAYSLGFMAVGHITIKSGSESRTINQIGDGLSRLDIGDILGGLFDSF